MRSFLAGAALLAVTLVPAGPSWAGDATKTANAASTTEVGGGKPLPVAFTCIEVEPRP